MDIIISLQSLRGRPAVNNSIKNCLHVVGQLKYKLDFRVTSEKKLCLRRTGGNSRAKNTHHDTQSGKGIGYDVRVMPLQHTAINSLPL